MKPKEKPERGRKRDPRFYNERELSILFSHINNERDLLMVYLMAFCGLKTAEVANLRICDISLENKTVRVRGSVGAMARTIPLDERISKLWSASRHFFPQSSTSRMFQKIRGDAGPLKLKSMIGCIERYAHQCGLPYCNPDTLRNSYGVMFASRGMKVKHIAGQMGIRDNHIVYRYKHLAGFAGARPEPGSGLLTRTARLLGRLVSKPVRKKSIGWGRVNRMPAQEACSSDERRKLRYNFMRRIDTLLIGPAGIGKSYLLNSLRSPNVIHLNNFVPLKSAVMSVARELHSHGRLVQCENAASWPDVLKACSKAAVADWCQMIVESVDQCEWTLIVDNMTGLTRSAADMLSRLGQKFVIFGAVREIKKSLETFFWKYDRLPVSPLSVQKARGLIRHLAGGMTIADYPFFESRVLHSSARNPRAICEIIERAKKEKAVTPEYTRGISHTGAVKRIDMSPVLVIIAALFVAGRFIARGAGNMEAYMFAGIGGAMFMVLRTFAWRTRR